jgi:hypothetical protein
MDETAWLSATDPQMMVEFLRASGRASKRKFRLFACACGRRIWHLLTDERSKEAIEVAERFVDGLAGDEELQNAMRAADQARHEFEEARSTRQENNADHAAGCAVWAAYYNDFPNWGPEEAALARMWENVQRGMPWELAKAQEQAQQCGLVRDLFGNPFHPSIIDPSWRTLDVVTLAGHIYFDRAFEQMQELADALEDACCDNADVLTHCRSGGTHVRGCWVVDLLLQKS